MAEKCETRGQIPPEMAEECGITIQIEGLSSLEDGSSSGPAEAEALATDEHHQCSSDGDHQDEQRSAEVAK